MLMNSYWTCSRFADWLRGTKKPYALGLEEWDDWKIAAKKAHPFRYWLAEDFLRFIQETLRTPVLWIRRKYYYFIRRYIEKNHCLVSTSLDFGQYHDFDVRLLHCIFDSMVTFVDKERGGVEGLKEEMQLTNADWIREGETPEPTEQAIIAGKLLKLYIWWTEKRPARPDPYEVSGFIAFCEEQRKTTGKMYQAFRDNRDEVDKMNARIRELETTYDAEDEYMLIRLMKIRKGLWT